MRFLLAMAFLLLSCLSVMDSCFRSAVCGVLRLGLYDNHAGLWKVAAKLKEGEEREIMFVARVAHWMI